MVIMVAVGVLEDVEDIEETPVGEVPLVELEGLLTILYVMPVGCVAIWHVTTPVRFLSHRVVAVAPLKAVHQDPGNEAQKVADEDNKFTLEA